MKRRSFLATCVAVDDEGILQKVLKEMRVISLESREEERLVIDGDPSAGRPRGVIDARPKEIKP